MGTYSSDEYLHTFGGLPEPGETYPADPDAVRDNAEDAARDVDVLADHLRWQHLRRVGVSSALPFAYLTVSEQERWRGEARGSA